MQNHNIVLLHNLKSIQNLKTASPFLKWIQTGFWKLPFLESQLDYIPNTDKKFGAPYKLWKPNK